MNSSRNSFGSANDLTVLDEGQKDTLEYRIKAVSEKDGSKPISLWHDVTLVHIDPTTNNPTPYLNFVNEIPKFSRKKFEIATDEVGNPIKQDTKKGELREVKCATNSAVLFVLYVLHRGIVCFRTTASSLNIDKIVLRMYRKDHSHVLLLLLHFDRSIV